MSMKKILAFPILCLSLRLFVCSDQERQGGERQMPFFGQDHKLEQSVVFNACCGNCAKKAAGDLKSFVGKAKAGNKACPFSGKAANKKVVVAFCCSKCKGKASS